MAPAKATGHQEVEAVVEVVSSNNNDCVEDVTVAEEKQEKIFKCVKCKVSFKDEASLEAHLLGKHDGLERPFQCPVPNCSKTYKKRNHLDEHQKVHGGKDRPYICVWCHHGTPTDHQDTKKEENNVEISTTRHDDDDNASAGEVPVSFSTGFSTVSFSTEKKLRLHILTKHQNNKCQECNKNFKSPYVLERHLASHSSQTSLSSSSSKTEFICEMCGAKYSALKRLRVHQMRHSNNNIEPYACDLCGKAFGEPRTLQVHRASVHEQVFKYHCNICGIGCQQIYMLNRHMLCHTAEKNYECSTCNLKFKRKPQLIIHERKHTGEKPFKCQICTKAFAEKKKLKNHETLHRGEKPFQCHVDGCSKAFALKHYLTHHINTSHKNRKGQLVEQVNQQIVQILPDHHHQQHSIIVQQQEQEQQEHEIVLGNLEETKFVSVEFIPDEEQAIVYTTATENGGLEVVGEWIQFGFVQNNSS